MSKVELPLISRLLGIILPILFIIIAIVLNAAYRQALFLQGVNIIYDMQSSGSGFLNFVQNIFSLFGNTITVVLFLGLYLFLVKNRLKVVVHLIFLTAALYYMTVLKQIFEESRPFWSSNQIKQLQWFCPLSFGNPSGHSFVVVVLYEPFISDVIGTGPKKLWTVLWAIIAALVLVSRMYLGAHSLDQIVLGGLLGLCFLIYYKFFLQQLLYQSITNILNNRYKQFYFILNTIIFLVFLTLPILTYILSSTSRPPVDSLYLSNIQTGCGKTITSDYLLTKNLNGTSLGFIAVGLFYGLLTLTNTHNQDVLYLTGRWSFRQPLCALYLLITLIIVAVIPAAILILVFPLFINSAVVNYILIAIAATWASFALVSILSKVQNKYRWIAYNSPQTQP